MKKFYLIFLLLAAALGNAHADTPLKRATNPLTHPTYAGFTVGNPDVENARQGMRTAPGYFQMPTAGSSIFSGNPKRQKAPGRIGASGSTIYGDLLLNLASNVPAGAVEAFLDGSIRGIAPVSYGTAGVETEYVLSYVRQGHLIGIGVEPIGFSTVNFYKYDVDLATGETTVTQLPDSPVYYASAYDPETDRVYAYAQSSVGIDFGYAPGSDPTNFTATGKLKSADIPEGGFAVIASTWNQMTDKFIAVYSAAYGGGVYEVDTTSGQLTKIGTIAQSSDYITGICYSPNDEGYVFAVCRNPKEAPSSICVLDANDFSVKSSTDYSNLVEFSMLACPDDRKIDSMAPGKATFVKSNFPEGALSGTVTFKLANVTDGGSPILGNIDWILEIDGKEYRRGSSASGSEVTVKCTDLKEGIHSFTFKSSLGSKAGRYCTTSFYVGNDTPAAPQSVTLNDKTIEWTPVTTGAHEGYVNPELVTYNVYLNNELIASGIKATECYAKLDSSKPLTNYVAAVEAVFDSKVSEKTFSNDISYGQALALPYSATPTEKESRLFSVVDANQDGTTINFDTFNLNKNLGIFTGFYYNYSETDDADDYLFLPILNFDDAKALYHFSADIFKIEKYSESFEILLTSSTDPASVVEVLQPEKEAVLAQNGQTEGKQDIYFTVPAAGKYHVAIHVTSPSYQASLWMNAFSVEKVDGITVANPEAVSGLFAQAAPEGQLKADVTFILPTKSINGTAYDADKTLTAKVQAAGCEAVSVSGKPGETVTTQAPALQGDNTVTVTAFDGELKSLSETTTVYVGLDTPSVPTDMKITVGADNRTAKITWKAPAIGANGGYVAPDGYDYFLGYFTGAEWIELEDLGRDVLSCEVQVPEGSEQESKIYGIKARNIAGLSPDYGTVSAVMGKPIDMPFLNDYNAGQITPPVLGSRPDTGTFTLRYGDPGSQSRYRPYSTPEKLKALFSYSSSSRLVNGRFTLPKFTTTGSRHASIELYVYGGSCKDFRIFASADGIEEEAISPLYLKEDFTTPGPVKIVLELPEKFQDKGWIMPAIHFNHASRNEVFILYSWKYFDNLDNDFGVASLSGDNIAHIGEETKFTAIAGNFGKTGKNAPASRWTLTREDGTVVADTKIPAGAMTEAGTTYEQQISFTPTVDDLGTMKLTFAIVDGDDKPVNDSKSIDVIVVRGQTPVVTDLHAKEIDFDHVDLEWTAPDNTVPTEESFENDTPFLLDKDSDMAGQFKRIDGDKSGVYGLGLPTFGELDWAYQPMSFMVWNKEELTKALGASRSFEPNSGSQFLAAICPSKDPVTGLQPAADDWLISPEVTGGSEFSFYIKPFTYDYGRETVEVLYSTTGTDTKDFKRLAICQPWSDTESYTYWEKFSYLLPKDAKYFAIHYVSRDVFGVMIDDISCSLAGENGNVTGYAVYRNGVLVGTATSTEFTDSDVEEQTEYSYFVIPLLDNQSKGLDSNVLVVRTTGIDGALASGGKVIYAQGREIIVKGFDGEHVAVVSTDGKTIASTTSASGRESYNVASGIYLVTAGKATVKLIVR